MINWKLRFKNKTTLVTLATAVVALVYQILGIFGVTPSISESNVIEGIGLIINALAVIGIVVDPTTEGTSDSKQALTYEEPKRD